MTMWTTAFLYLLNASMPYWKDDDHHAGMKRLFEDFLRCTHGYAAAKETDELQETDYLADADTGGAHLTALMAVRTVIIHAVLRWLLGFANVEM